MITKVMELYLKDLIVNDFWASCQNMFSKSFQNPSTKSLINDFPRWNELFVNNFMTDKKSSGYYFYFRHIARDFFYSVNFL